MQDLHTVNALQATISALILTVQISSPTLASVLSPTLASVLQAPGQSLSSNTHMCRVISDQIRSTSAQEGDAPQY